LTTKELPPLLTEGAVREQQQQSTSTPSLTVLKPTSTRTQTREVSVPQDQLPPETEKTEVAESKEPPQQKQLKEKQSPKDDNSSSKAWILQQYQYYEENEEEDALPMIGDDQADETIVLQQSQQEEEDTAAPNQDSNNNDTTEQDQPDQIALQKLQLQLQQQEMDLADDAANYMRSKQELKDLKVTVKRLKQHVQGLERKIAKAKAKTKAAASQSEGNTQPQGVVDTHDNGNDNEDEGECGIFGMLGEEEEEAYSASQKSEQQQQDSKEDISPTPPPKDPVVPKDSIPAGWTGTTPKQILHDRCKKQKIRQPQYFKMSRNNGARIQVATVPEKGTSSKSNTAATTMITVETDNYMGSYMDAQHYLATRVLYELDPNLPLHRLMPPFYRDLWQSWSQKVQQEQDAQQQQHQDAIQAKIQRLMECIPTKQPSTSTSTITKSNATTSFSTTDATQGTTTSSKAASINETNRKTTLAPVTRDCWDDEVEWDATDVSEDENDLWYASKVNQQASSAIMDDDATSTETPATLHPSSSPNSTRSGTALKEAFLQRQSTTKYQSMLQVRSTLPMYTFRTLILEKIRANPVTILCAETGAGKTTQCPQFILEEAFLQGHGDAVSVICTQPRRVAATSVAERVSEEMAERTLGDTVGYQIRLEAKRSSQTRLLFCTTGVILRRLQDDPTLQGITHVVVDEVHERQYQVRTVE
jgi:hypothetical protein